MFYEQFDTLIPQDIVISKLLREPIDKNGIEYYVSNHAQSCIIGSCMPIQSNIHCTAKTVNKIIFLFTKLQNGNTQKS